MDNKINIRLRIITIADGKVLLMYDSENDYYFYIGGKLEYGESVIEGAEREIKEECGEDTNFEFKKILYIRDYIDMDKSEHSLELFILADISKLSELEGRKDPEFNGKKWLMWKELNNLPENLYPSKLTEKLINDYKSGFPNQGEYIGNI